MLEDVSVAEIVALLQLTLNSPEIFAPESEVTTTFFRTVPSLVAFTGRRKIVERCDKATLLPLSIYPHIGTLPDSKVPSTKFCSAGNSTTFFSAVVEAEYG